MPLRQYPQPTESGWYWAKYYCYEEPELIKVEIHNYVEILPNGGTHHKPESYVSKILVNYYFDIEDFTFLSARIPTPYEFVENLPEGGKA